MTQNWNVIWNRRSVCVGAGKRLHLDDLIKLDGFDTGAGRIEASDWRIYADLIAQKLRIYNGATVFEVGCGSGALLYALQQKHSLTVGGIDYATGLIATAIRAMPEGEFKVLEAKHMETEPQYDYVIANSVFHYFNLDYASGVMARMIKKARNAVAIMEVPDLKTKMESEEMRRNMLTQEEYDIKYAGLEHTYYARDWFKDQAKYHGLECELFDGCIPNYAQNKFCFGVILRIN